MGIVAPHEGVLEVRSPVQVAVVGVGGGGGVLEETHLLVGGGLVNGGHGGHGVLDRGVPHRGKGRGTKRRNIFIKEKTYFT